MVNLFICFPFQTPAAITHHSVCWLTSQQHLTVHVGKKATLLIILMCKRILCASTLEFMYTKGTSVCLVFSQSGYV